MFASSERKQNNYFKSPNNDYPIKVWKIGSIINAIFIGVVPQIALVIADFQRGVTRWQFNQTNLNNFTSEFNDAIFKHRFGNTAFSLICLVFFSIIIALFFYSDKIFVRNGIHCRVFNILFCPCPNSCLIYHPDFESDTKPFESNIETSKTGDDTRHVNSPASRLSLLDDKSRSNTLIYCYSNKGTYKSWIAGNPVKRKENIKLEVYCITIVVM